MAKQKIKRVSKQEIGDLMGLRPIKKGPFKILKPYKFYRLSKRFHTVALRRATIQLIRPVTPAGKTYVAKVIYDVNEEWKAGDTIVIKPKDVIDRSIQT